MTVLWIEPETSVYQQLADDVQFDGFLSLHSGIRQIYIPFAGRWLGFKFIKHLRDKTKKSTNIVACLWTQRITLVNKLATSLRAWL